MKKSSSTARCSFLRSVPTTGGWKVFMAYVGIFTLVVFGAVVAGKLLSWRKR